MSVWYRTGKFNEASLQGIKRELMKTTVASSDDWKKS